MEKPGVVLGVGKLAIRSQKDYVRVPGLGIPEKPGFIDRPLCDERDDLGLPRGKRADREACAHPGGPSQAKELPAPGEAGKRGETGKAGRGDGEATRVEIKIPVDENEVPALASLVGERSVLQQAPGGESPKHPVGGGGFAAVTPQIHQKPGGGNMHQQGTEQHPVIGPGQNMGEGIEELPDRSHPQVVMVRHFLFQVPTGGDQRRSHCKVGPKTDAGLPPFAGPEGRNCDQGGAGEEAAGHREEAGDPDGLPHPPAGLSRSGRKGERQMAECAEQQKMKLGLESDHGVIPTDRCREQSRDDPANPNPGEV